MKNWVKVNKKDIENVLSKNLNVELSKTSDDIYSDIYLIKVKRISTVREEKEFIEESAITDLIDAKLFSALETITSNIDNQNLYDNLERKLESKINELKNLTISLEDKLNEMKHSYNSDLIDELNNKFDEIRSNSNSDLKNQINDSMNEIKETTQMLDQKIEQKILEMQSRLETELSVKLDSEKLESKLNDIKLEFSNIQKNFVDINRDIQAQARTNGKSFDYLIKKTTRIESRLDVFDRDMKKIKAIPDIKKELIIKKSKPKINKVKTLNAINGNVTIKQAKVAKNTKI